MKTSQIIDLLCTAISSVDYATRSVVATGFEDGGKLPNDGYMGLSESASLVRILWGELPDALQDEYDTENLIIDFYPHLLRDADDGFNLTRWESVVSGVHSMCYRMWSDMDTSRCKFGL